MGVLLTHISEYHISQLIRTVHAVSESPIKIKESFLEHCSLVCHFDMLENAHFEARIHPIAFGGRAPPGSAGGAYSAPQIP